MTVPRFVAVGHVVQDLAPGGWRLGGTVTFAAVQAQRLGIDAGVVTVAEPSLNLPERLPGVAVAGRDDGVTRFENVYIDARRVQYVRGRAEPLTLEDVPPAWRRAPIALVGPVCAEVPASLPAGLECALIGVSAQGWLREVGPEGRVRKIVWRGEPFWRGAHLVVASDEDVEPDPSQVERWAKEAAIVALTLARRGVRVHAGGVWLEMPAYAREEVDPTGAGDVFAAAFLIRYHETTDVREAMRFASAAASLAVGAPGVDGIGGREEIEAVIRAHPEVEVA